MRKLNNGGLGSQDWELVSKKREKNSSLPQGSGGENGIQSERGNPTNSKVKSPHIPHWGKKKKKHSRIGGDMRFAKLYPEELEKKSTLAQGRRASDTG